MKLDAFLPRLEQRYAIAGLAIGIALLGIIPMLEILIIGTHPSHLVGIVMSNPNLVSAGFIPFFLAGAFYLFGRSQAEEQKRAERERRDRQQREYRLLLDDLTGLGNRTALSGILDGGQRQALLLAPGNALICIDLDRFKFVNSALGHEFGDEILKCFAARLRANCGPDHSIFRLGGDEFAIHWKNAPVNDAELLMFCEKLLVKTTNPVAVRDTSIELCASIGVTRLRLEDSSISTALRRADLALLNAKGVYGNFAVLFQPDMEREDQERLQIERDLSRALAEEELFLEFQPINCARTLKIRGFESLVRWNHPTNGRMRPDRFIPVAERTGQIIHLGRWVMEKSCLAAAAWPKQVSVSVNVSGNEFSDGRFVEHVVQCLEKAQISPNRLIIEVTESVFLIDVTVASRCIDELRQIGVRVALDDFGTGYSTISHLREFPLDCLKIDKSYTDGLLNGGRDARLVSILLKLAENFDLATTVEGVESREQLTLIRSAGASQIQGYFISQPVDAEGAHELIDSYGVDHTQTGSLLQKGLGRPKSRAGFTTIPHRQQSGFAA